MREQHDAADRIEAALDRIERLAHTLPLVPSASVSPEPAPPELPNAVLAARLDRLITQLRAALDDAEA